MKLYIQVESIRECISCPCLAGWEQVPRISWCGHHNASRVASEARIDDPRLIPHWCPLPDLPANREREFSRYLRIVDRLHFGPAGGTIAALPGEEAERG